MSQSVHRLIDPGARSPGQAHDADAPPQSVDEVYRQCAAYVATIGLRLLGRPDEVEDFVQDVFLEVRRDFSRLRDRAALRGWLATIAVRVAHRRLPSTWQGAWSGRRRG